MKKVLLLMCLSVILFNCQNEEIIHMNEETEFILQESPKFKTLSIEKSFQFFKERDEQFKKKSSIDKLRLEPDLMSVKQEKMTNTDAMLTVIPARTKHSNVNTRILQVESSEGKVVSMLFNMTPNTNSSVDAFSGVITLTTMDGKLIEGYRLEKGIATKEIRPMGVVNTDCDEALNPNSVFCNDSFEEVVIRATNRNLMRYHTYHSTMDDRQVQWRYLSNGYYGYGAAYMSYIRKKNCEAYGGEYRNGKCMGIINRLSNKCAKNIFTQLENGIYKNHPLKPEVQISNPNISELNFSETILKLFNVSDQTNYTIQNSNITDANAKTDNITNVTTISNSYLQNATTLSIARTMIHEQVHAYLNSVYYGRKDISYKPFQDKLRRFANEGGFSDLNRFHHEFMGQYVDAIAYSLYEWDRVYGSGKDLSNISSPDDLLGWDYYHSMAFGGLYYEDANGNQIETDSFKKLVPKKSDRDKIKQILEDEQNGSNAAKGKKCN